MKKNMKRVAVDKMIKEMVSERNKKSKKKKKLIGNCEGCGEKLWLALKKINGVEKAICEKCYEEEMMKKRGECIPFRKNEIRNAIIILKDYLELLDEKYGHLNNTYSGFFYMTRRTIAGRLIKKLDRRRIVSIDEYCAMCGKKKENDSLVTTTKIFRG